MTDAPRTFYWSDMHFGHETTVKDRGFASVAEHDASIITAWTETVKPQDTIYVMGDISSGNEKATSRALTIIGKMPGRKILLPGNRDIVHPMHRPNLNSVKPWHEVFDDIRLSDYDKFKGHEFVMSHFPYLGDERRASIIRSNGRPADDTKYAQFRMPDLGLPLIHGHTHQPMATWPREEWRTPEGTESRMLNIGVDANPHPVSKDDIWLWLDSLEGSK